MNQTITAKRKRRTFMNKDVELKPCPFCAWEAGIVDDGQRYTIRCCHCGAEITVNAHTRLHAGAEAWRRWNRRSTERSFDD